MTVPGGRVSFTPCVFPFNYGGVENITGCISTYNGEMPWCATKTGEDGDMLEGHWGQCQDNCTGDQTVLTDLSS